MFGLKLGISICLIWKTIYCVIEEENVNLEVMILSGILFSCYCYK